MKGISRYKRERMYSILLDGESVIGIEKVSKGSEGLVDTPPEWHIEQPWKGTASPSSSSTTTPADSLTLRTKTGKQAGTSTGGAGTWG